MKTSKTIAIFVLLSFLWTLLPASTAFAQAGRCYVDVDATGANNGTSWTDAYTDLQSALGVSPCTEVWVAAGTYTPTATNDRTATFQLKTGVGAYGGFAGTETTRDQRNPAANTTTLSGEIGVPGISTDNSYHVVTGSGTASTAVLDGFTITGGYATNESGGGMYNNAGSPTLTNVTFSGNWAYGSGGGMFNINGSSPTLMNVTFSDNKADYSGGGMCNYNGSSPTLMNVTFSDNKADYFGGGMYNYSSSPTLTDVTFSANTASAAAGGGMGNYNGSSPILTNVTFSGNWGFGAGGGMYNYNGSSPILTNVTFSGNWTYGDGGGMRNDKSNPTLTNVILWGNSASSGNQIFNVSGSTSSITDSVVQGDCPTDSTCTNIITTDPKLGALADNGGATQTMALGSGSSAIDAGGVNAACANTDQRGVTRPQGAGCDIGAYEVDNTSPEVVTTSLAVTYSSSGPVTFTVTFTENISNLGGSNDTNDAENPNNYILVEEGSPVGFQTTACNDTDFTQDTRITVGSVSYNSGTFTSTVSINGGAALPAGSYKLLVCGTTSIIDLANNRMYGGDFDYPHNFVVTAATTTAASALPATGFRHGRVTSLPEQPAAKAYTSTELTLEIPALGVTMPIVGVPQTETSWDVTWLGNSAGWLNGSAFPTWNGNTVLTGHVWDAYNQPGPFAELKTLKYGDQFTIHAWGQVYTYEVRESKSYWVKTAYTKVFQHEELDWVTLVTCETYNPFDGGYFFRRAVRAVLVSVK